MIVGLSGYAGAGKDTVANLLEDAGFKRIAFADALRQMLYSLDPIILPGDLTGEESSPVRVKEMVDFYGWDKAKREYPEIRALLQRLGTEAGRMVLGESVWVDLVMNQIADEPEQDWVITDVRFPNEIEAVVSYGGLTVWVNRPGYGPVNGHASDNTLTPLDCAYTLQNSGDVENVLHDRVVDLLMHIEDLEAYGRSQAERYESAGYL